MYLNLKTYQCLFYCNNPKTLKLKYFCYVQKLQEIKIKFKINGVLGDLQK